MEEIIKGGVKLVATTSIGKIVESIVDSYIKPKFEKAYKDAENYKNIELIEEKLQCYIERSYNNCLTMNTIVFKNEQKKINELYIPLTVIKKNEFEQKEERINIRIDRYRDDFIPEYKKILLVDTAGMGKSTIMKYLFLSSITEKRGIPILIELRRLNKDNSIMDHIMNEINDIREQFRKEDILGLIEEGDFIFFFDGYDEITPESKEIVTNNLQDFISKSDNNMFIISSREENELNCFGDFQRFDINSLTKEEAYSLIRKYDNEGELSRILIKRLETEENLVMIKEFLENPLMVSLLYKAFEYKKTIPYKKHIFYRQVYDALFEEHDLSKSGAFKRNKKSGLDIEDFHRILRNIGLITLAKGIIYSKEEFIEIINQAKKKNNDLDFNSNDLIYDLINIVPIFVKDGIKYRWSHKSFQEYFASSYICIDSKDRQQKLMNMITTHEKIYKYYNVLDFCYDIDYKQFSRNIVYPIICDLKEFWNSAYNDRYYDNFDKADIDLRKNLEFRYNKVILVVLDKDQRIRLHSPNIADVFEEVFQEPMYNAVYRSIDDSGLGVSIGDARMNALIKLLYNKESDIVEANYEKSSVRGVGLLYKLDSSEYELNDSINNELNSKKLFNIVNEYILERAYNSGDYALDLLFNYEKCIKLKMKIEEDIDAEKYDIDFL